MHGIIWKIRFLWNFYRMGGLRSSSVRFMWQAATVSYNCYGNEHPADVAADELYEWFGGV